jgi:hypothetical protein
MVKYKGRECKIDEERNEPNETKEARGAYALLTRGTPRWLPHATVSCSQDVRSHGSHNVRVGLPLSNS